MAGGLGVRRLRIRTGFEIRLLYSVTSFVECTELPVVIVIFACSRVVCKKASFDAKRRKRNENQVKN